MKPRLYILVFLAALALYFGTRIENRTEAEDAYSYALAVEEKPCGDLLHRHHLLYGPLAKLGYEAARWVGYPGRSLPFLVSVSSLSGAVSVVLMALFCRRRLGLQATTAVAAAGLLGVSYGFWRYACEAEIYVPATAAALAALHLATGPMRTTRRVMATGLVGAFAVLIHVLNVIPVLLVIPLHLAGRKQARQAALHVVTVLCMVGAMYGALAGASPREAVAPAPLTQQAAALAPSAGAQAIVGLGQSIVSGNFLLAYSEFRESLERLFPTRMLEEEFFMGEAAGPAARYLPVLTLAAVILLAGLLVILRLRRVLTSSEPPDPPPAGKQPGGVHPGSVAAWAAAYALLILFYEPGNPELWIMVLPAVWVLAGSWVLDPLVARGYRGLVLLAPLVLLLHSVSGGMALLADPEGDYSAKKAERVLDMAGADDVIVTAGNPVFVRYLRYYAPCPVECLYEWPELEVAARDRRLRATRGTVFALGDVFAPPPSLAKRFPEAGRRVAAQATHMASAFDKVESDRFGGIFILSNQVGNSHISR